MTSLFQRFDPGSKTGRRKGAARRFQRVPLRVVLPNMVTLLALCSGLTAVRLALDDRLELAMMAILLAAFLDALDGRLARLLKGTSRFGAELDSLTDFVNFGVAPALILYQSSLAALDNLGWIAALIYAICTGLRLARFNAALDTVKPSYAVHFFTGIPAPAGALLALLPMYFALLGGRWLTELPLLVALYIVVIGLFMVSSLPTLSGKRFGARLPSDSVLPLMVGAAALVALLVAFTWQVLIALALVYLAMLPVGLMVHRRMASAERASETTALATEAEPEERRADASDD
ncbi:MAG: CDP-diacylglycerol--serine O-phosphatidyltransferase [Devosiaceae bacterium]|nr:CDP-diacylglycerol--serine O-phosphatidyltransferase [Devosiaceae bacterium MH13]